MKPPAAHQHGGFLLSTPETAGMNVAESSRDTMRLYSKSFGITVVSHFSKWERFCLGFAILVVSASVLIVTATPLIACLCHYGMIGQK